MRLPAGIRVAAALCLAAAAGACGEEIYDPGAPAFSPANAYPNWATLAPLPAARGALTVAEVGGLIYAFGGSRSGPLATNESYNPATNAWTSGTAMPTARSYLTSAVVGTKVYVIGGLTDETANAEVATDVIEAYDTGTGTWNVAPLNPVASARAFAAAAAVDTKIYLFGGFNEASSTRLDDVDEYDTGLGTWAAKLPMSSPRTNAAVAEVGGIIYVIGGYDGSDLSTVEAYDPTGNTWTSKASMPTARYAATAGVINGLIYVTGGFNNALDTYYRTVEVYNPATNTWSTGRPMPTRRGWLGGAVLNGYHYVVGGFLSGSAVTTVEAQTSP